MKRNPVVGDIIAIKNKQLLVVDGTDNPSLVYQRLVTVPITDSDLLNQNGATITGDRRISFAVTSGFVGTEPLANVRLIATTNVKEKVSVTYIIGPVKDV